MPITPEVDIFSGLETTRKGLCLKWTYAADESGEGYLEPINFFENNVKKIRAEGNDLPEQMKLAEEAIKAATVDCLL